MSDELQFVVSCQRHAVIDSECWVSSLVFVRSRQTKKFIGHKRSGSTSGNDPLPKNTLPANRDRPGSRISPHMISARPGDLTDEAIRLAHKREVNFDRNACPEYRVNTAALPV